MLVRPLLVILAAVALAGAACAPGAPADTPTPEAPAPTPEEATPTPAVDEATPTPAAAATGTPMSQDPDDYYGDPYGGGARATPAPDGDGATLEVHASATQGDYLVGPAGLALYVFTTDQPGMSMCTGTCAQTWPPVTVDDGDEPTAGDGVVGTLALIERADGSRQVTYNDAPLYYFAGDQSIDDTTGDGVGGNWHLARPDAGGAGGGGSPEY